MMKFRMLESRVLNWMSLAILQKWHYHWETERDKSGGSNETVNKNLKRVESLMGNFNHVYSIEAIMSNKRTITAPWYIIFNTTSHYVLIYRRRERGKVYVFDSAQCNGYNNSIMSAISHMTKNKKTKVCFLTLDKQYNVQCGPFALMYLDAIAAGKSITEMTNFTFKLRRKSHKFNIRWSDRQLFGPIFNFILSGKNAREFKGWSPGQRFHNQSDNCRLVDEIGTDFTQKSRPTSSSPEPSDFGWSD